MTQAPFSLLLVDDDAPFRERLGLAFRRRGYTVTTAVDAETALQMIEKQQFDGAVVDLKLPGENGLAVVRHLHLHSPKARIIILTGYGSIATAIDAIRLGAIDYLSKPVDTDQIENALLKTEQALTTDPTDPVQMPSLDRVEWEHLQRVLRECGGNISKTARVLGMERRSLQRKLQKEPPRE